MLKGNMNRRGFFTTLAKMTGVALVTPLAISAAFSSKAHAQKKRGSSDSGSAMPLIDPNDSVAKAVKYVEDAKMAPESKGNNCANCGFYAKKEERNKLEVGTCTIFAGKLVYAKAWCGSWNKKA